MNMFLLLSLLYLFVFSPAFIDGWITGTVTEDIYFQGEGQKNPSPHPSEIVAEEETADFTIPDYGDFDIEQFLNISGKDGPKKKQKTSDNIISTFNVTLSAIGLLANCVVFFVIFCGDEISKTVTSIYVIQLAIADCAFLITLPFFAWQQMHYKWIFGEATCTICQTIKVFNYYGGIFFLTAMSIDRYVAVAYSTKSHKIRSRNRTIISCIFVWITATIMSIPEMIYAKIETVVDIPICRIILPGYKNINASFFEINPTPTDNTIESGSSHRNNQWVCDYSNHPTSYYIIENTKFVIGFVLPLFVITSSYVLIIKQLRDSEQRLSNRGSRTQNMRKRVTRMVAALVICFFVCWLPYHVYNLARFRGMILPGEWCFGIEQVVAMIGAANSALNPILYTFLGHNFRERLIDSLVKTRRRLSRGSRALAGSHLAISRKSSNKNRSHSKRAAGKFSEMRPAPSGLVSTGTTETENQAPREGKGIPLLELNHSKQESTWECIPEKLQEEKRNGIGRSVL